MQGALVTQPEAHGFAVAPHANPGLSPFSNRASACFIFAFSFQAKFSMMRSRPDTLGGFKDPDSSVVPTPYLQDESVPFLSPAHSGHQSSFCFVLFCF